MGTVILVRHGAHSEVGHVLSGRSDIGLSAEGRAQAEALAEALSLVPIASLHSSPRRRALETIAPLAGKTGMQVRRAEALDEIDFGAFTGRSFAALGSDPAWEGWNSHRAVARCPGGETMGEAVARALDYLRALPVSAMPALCVTHCDIIRGILAEQSGRGLASLFDFECDPASVTTLTFGVDGVRVLGINERC